VFEYKERQRLEGDLKTFETALNIEAQVFLERENFEFKVDGKTTACFIRDIKGLYQQEKENKKKERVS
jgi:hypothetical protein